jgi:hypothetical protein
MIGNPLYLRHANRLVMGDPREPGERGNFDPSLARVSGRVELAPMNRPNRRQRRRGAQYHRGRGKGNGNRFRMGAMTGQFSTMGLLALAAVGVGGYLLLKKA